MTEQFDEMARHCRRLERAQELSRAGSWESDLRTGETTWSTQLHRMMGTDPETMVIGPDTYLECVHPDDRARMEDLRREMQAGLNDKVMRYRIIRADNGEVRQIETEVYVELGDQGQPILVIGTAQDVSEFHRLEQERTAALHELRLAKQAAETREQLLEEAQSLAGVGSWAMDTRTGEVTWSRQMHELFGTDPETTEVDFETGMQSFDAKQAERTRQFFEEVVESRSSGSIEQRITRADGQQRIQLGRARPEFDEQGELVRVVGTTQDITEARQLEQERAEAATALAKANEELARQSVALAEAQRLAGVGSWSLDLESGTVEWSAQMRRLCGDDLTGPGLTLEEFWDRIHPDDLERVAATQEAGMAAGGDFMLEFRHRLPSGEDRIFLATNLVELRDGRPVRITGATQDVTSQRRAVQVQERVRRELEEAQRLSGIGSWVYELSSGHLTWSAQMYRIYGTESIEDFEPTLDVVMETIHAQDREQVAEVLGAAMSSGETYQVEFRLIRIDGAERILLIRGQAELGDGGQVIRLNGTGQDVTDARRAEREQAEARDGLEEAQRIAGVGSWTVDLAGGETIWSAQMHRIYGTDPRTFTPSVDAYLGLFDPAERDQIETIMRGALQDGNEYEIEHWLTRPDGTRCMLAERGQLAVDENGKSIKLRGTAQDVTDARRTQRDLIEAKDLFQQVLSAATDQAILGIDQDGRLTLFNRGAESMLGYSSEEMLGRSPWSILSPPKDQKQGEPLNAPVDGDDELHRWLPGEDEERIWRCRNGDEVVVQTSITAMRDHVGVVTGHLCIATDVTERREAERARDHAEQEVRDAMVEISAARDEALAANQAKSAFLATMSHEIRTPMNAVIGMTGLLLDTGLDAEQRDLLETVRGSGDQLLAIINDILDFSKIEAGDLDLEYRSFDLRDLVEGTVAQFAGSARGLDLLSHVDDACPAHVIGDVTRLRQVLSNLISNAIKFTSAGDVLLHVTRLEQEDDQINLLFQVRDTGIGIPEESMHRLFKSFSQVDASTTRTYGGTGLGLAISRALVTAMGGDIWVESTLGEGSTFSFSVQLSQDTEEPEAKPGVMDVHGLRSALAGRRVLIVDDNATNRRILQMQLASYGARGIEVPGSVEALQALSDADQSFDLAVLDLVMPVLDGVQLAAAIRRVAGREQLPVVLLSSIGRRLGEDEDHLFSAVLTKPVRSVPLMEALARAIDPAPAVHPIPAQGGPRPAEASSPREGFRILLAEDNEVNQKVGRLMLAKLGYHPDIVANGQDALTAALEQDYDVILMDMHMPVMDGLEATRRIRTEVEPMRQPTIIAMTASVTMQDREACAEAGMNDYLPKPVRASDLAAKLEQAHHV